MGCDCDTHCPDSTSCMCVFTHDDGVCNCDCFGPIVITSSAQSRKKRPLDALVSLCVKEVELGTLGEFLSRISDAELLIPAAKAKTKLSIEIKEASLESAIAKVGLIVR